MTGFPTQEVGQLVTQIPFVAAQAASRAGAVSIHASDISLEAERRRLATLGLEAILLFSRQRSGTTIVPIVSRSQFCADRSSCRVPFRLPGGNAPLLSLPVRRMHPWSLKALGQSLVVTLWSSEVVQFQIVEGRNGAQQMFM